MEKISTVGGSIVEAIILDLLSIFLIALVSTIVLTMACFIGYSRCRKK